MMQAHVNTEYYKTALVAIDHIDRLVEHKEIPIESIRYNLDRSSLKSTINAS